MQPSQTYTSVEYDVQRYPVLERHPVSQVIIGSPKPGTVFCAAKALCRNADDAVFFAPRTADTKCISCRQPMHAICGYDIKEDTDPECTLLCNVCAITPEVFALHAREDITHEEVMGYFHGVVEIANNNMVTPMSDIGSVEEDITMSPATPRTQHPPRRLTYPAVTTAAAVTSTVSTTTVTVTESCEPLEKMEPMNLEDPPSDAAKEEGVSNMQPVPPMAGATPLEEQATDVDTRKEVSTLLAADNKVTESKEADTDTDRKDELPADTDKAMEDTVAILEEDAAVDGDNKVAESTVAITDTGKKDELPADTDKVMEDTVAIVTKDASAVVASDTTQSTSKETEDAGVSKKAIPAIIINTDATDAITKTLDDGSKPPVTTSKPMSVQLEMHATNKEYLDFIQNPNPFPIITLGNKTLLLEDEKPPVGDDNYEIPAAEESDVTKEWAAHVRTASPYNPSEEGRDLASCVFSLNVYLADSMRPFCRAYRAATRLASNVAQLFTMATEYLMYEMDRKESLNLHGLHVSSVVEYMSVGLDANETIACKRVEKYYRHLIRHVEVCDGTRGDEEYILAYINGKYQQRPEMYKALRDKKNDVQPPSSDTDIITISDDKSATVSVSSSQQRRMSGSPANSKKSYYSQCSNHSSNKYRHRSSINSHHGSKGSLNSPPKTARGSTKRSNSQRKKDRSTSHHSSKEGKKKQRLEHSHSRDPSHHSSKEKSESSRGRGRDDSVESGSEEGKKRRQHDRFVGEPVGKEELLFCLMSAKESTDCLASLPLQPYPPSVEAPFNSTLAPWDGLYANHIPKRGKLGLFARVRRLVFKDYFYYEAVCACKNMRADIGNVLGLGHVVKLPESIVPKGYVTVVCGLLVCGRWRKFVLLLSVPKPPGVAAKPELRTQVCVYELKNLVDSHGRLPLIHESASPAVWQQVKDYLAWMMTPGVGCVYTTVKTNRFHREAKAAMVAWSNSTRDDVEDQPRMLPKAPKKTSALERSSRTRKEPQRFSPTEMTTRSSPSPARRSTTSKPRTQPSPSANLSISDLAEYQMDQDDFPTPDDVGNATAPDSQNLTAITRALVRARLQERTGTDAAVIAESRAEIRCLSLQLREERVAQRDADREFRETLLEERRAAIEERRRVDSVHMERMHADRRARDAHAQKIAQQTQKHLGALTAATVSNTRAIDKMATATAINAEKQSSLLATLNNFVGATQEQIQLLKLQGQRGDRALQEQAENHVATMKVLCDVVQNPGQKFTPEQMMAIERRFCDIKAMVQSNFAMSVGTGRVQLSQTAVSQALLGDSSGQMGWNSLLNTSLIPTATPTTPAPAITATPTTAATTATTATTLPSANTAFGSHFERMLRDPAYLRQQSEAYTQRLEEADRAAREKKTE